MDGLDRRAFLGSSLAATLTLSVAEPAAAAGPPLRAAVLEYTDRLTQATGLAELLRRAGMTVVPLDVSAPATGQGVDLIVFGSFTNDDAAYHSFVAAHAESIRRFVADGGVVLDLAQTDERGAVVTYLPAPMSAVRANQDFDPIYPSTADHPLVAGLRTVNGQLFTGRGTKFRVSSETLVEWRSMRVLMSCSTVVQPPCLLEGAHGAGRFLVSTLTVDKCFDASGAAVQPPEAVEDSVAFFTAVAAYVRSVKDGTAPEVVPTSVPTAGPMVGDVATRHARIWLRPGADHQHLGTWVCTVRSGNGPTHKVRADLSARNDHTVIFEVRRLAPATRYTYTIRPAGPSTNFTPLTGSFTTAPPDGTPARITMGLGSCVYSGPNAIWDRIVAEGCDSFVMMGDTPYIDSTDLRVARAAHRGFLTQPDVARVTRSMPIWGTWDDHDFGLNDSHGDQPGKENNRTAFVDYRANPTYGHTAAGDPQTGRGPGEGVYTSFRRGPVEVFLLDPRWFSRTAPSWADPTQPTCLGSVQWQWLRAALRRSTAPFKVVATGMIWDDKQNSESDDWGTYAHEREAVFDFIAAEKIPGVVLLGGDIHVSRALNYGPRVGYDLWQYIVSPMHHSTIPSLNVPHPALVHSAVEPHVFLKLVADTTVTPATLTATWINRDGTRIFEVHRTADDIGHPPPPD